MSYKLSSNFKLYIEGLIEQKQAVGYPYDTSSRILKDFDRFCSKHHQVPGGDVHCCRNGNIH